MLHSIINPFHPTFYQILNGVENEFGGFFTRSILCFYANDFHYVSLLGLAIFCHPLYFLFSLGKVNDSFDNGSFYSFQNLLENI